MNNPLFIERTGSVYFAASKDGVQPDLKTQVNEVCSQKFRRIDRFTQLALIGSVACVQTTIDTQTALYLATGKGPAGNNIAVQQDIFRDRTAPMPIRFINAVSNSVSFYVMKNFGLTRQNLLVSRDVHAFEASLEVAASDLHTGHSSQALLGMVDEITHPVDEQCVRLGLPPGTLLGEGSCWFLLSVKRSAKSLGCIKSSQLLDNDQELQSWLATIEGSDELFISFGQNMDTNLKRLCMTRLPRANGVIDATQAHWDGINAGTVSAFVSQTRDASLAVVSKDREGRFQATFVESYT